MKRPPGAHPVYWQTLKGCVPSRTLSHDLSQPLTRILGSGLAKGTKVQTIR